MATVAFPTGNVAPMVGGLLVKLVPSEAPEKPPTPSPGATMDTGGGGGAQLVQVAAKSPKAVLPPPAAFGSTRDQVPATSLALGPKKPPWTVPLAALEKPALPAPAG